MQLPYDPAFALLIIYSRENEIYGHLKIWTQIFIVALFINKKVESAQMSFDRYMVKLQ